jgi:hypothetical protein
MQINNYINQLDSMYPSEGYLLTRDSVYTHSTYAKYSSVYGYAFSDSTLVVDGKQRTIESGQYFAFFVKESLTVNTVGKVFIVVRLGYKVVDQLGWVERQGRLSYIDGCSDSLLVYPSRLGDPSLNLLYFPKKIDQSFHLHPSIRIGCVIDGNGYSTFSNRDGRSESVLESGNMFCLEEQELHRFRTEDSSMTIIAWHPDGDWGPTDHNHTMINRTYLSK